MPTVAAPAIIATTAVVAVDTVDLAQLPSWLAPCCCGAAAMASWSFDVATLSPLLSSSPLSWSLSWWSRAPPHRIALVALPFLLVLVLLACRWHRNRTCVGETPAVVASLFDLLCFHACGCQRVGGFAVDAVVVVVQCGFPTSRPLPVLLTHSDPYSDPYGPLSFHLKEVHVNDDHESTTMTTQTSPTQPRAARANSRHWPAREGPVMAAITTMAVPQQRRRRLGGDHDYDRQQDDDNDATQRQHNTNDGTKQHNNNSTTRLDNSDSK
ncbi:hypothetical protein EDB85DRAFT_1892494 [Lactarius pseudohatsudake]|nr:hypothetical protein EDB85DRAFT_1892494 [Lactarius pseudohatsudake]